MPTKEAFCATCARPIKLNPEDSALPDLHRIAFYCDVCSAPETAQDCDFDSINTE